MLQGHPKQQSGWPGTPTLGTATDGRHSPQQGEVDRRAPRTWWAGAPCRRLKRRLSGWRRRPGSGAAEGQRKRDRGHSGKSRRAGAPATQSAPLPMRCPSAPVTFAWPCPPAPPLLFSYVRQPSPWDHDFPSKGLIDSSRTIWTGDDGSCSAHPCPATERGLTTGAMCSAEAGQHQSPREGSTWHPCLRSLWLSQWPAVSAHLLISTERIPGHSAMGGQMPSLLPNPTRRLPSLIFPLQTPE